MTEHKVIFQRNQRTGMWRSICICGWMWAGFKDDVQTRAATHDMDWENVNLNAPEQQEAK
jgi:hypothetical protein